MGTDRGGRRRRPVRLGRLGRGDPIVSGGVQGAPLAVKSRERALRARHEDLPASPLHLQPVNGIARSLGPAASHLDLACMGGGLRRAAEHAATNRTPWPTTAAAGSQQQRLAGRTQAATTTVTLPARAPEPPPPSPVGLNLDLGPDRDCSRPPAGPFRFETSTITAGSRRASESVRSSR